MFLHTFDSGGIYWQGRVVAMDGDMVLVELFSWLTAEPTEVVAIPKETIYTPSKCTLYLSADKMRVAYEKIVRRERRPLRAGV